MHFNGQKGLEETVHNGIFQQRVGEIALYFQCCSHGFLITTCEHARIGDEMQIVQAVARVVVINPFFLYIHIVYFPGLDVAVRGLLPHTQKHIDMTGHVDQVTRRGKILPQYGTRRQRDLRMGAHFHQMHHEMVQSWMIRCHEQGLLQHLLGHYGMRGGQTGIQIPQPPGAFVEQSFGIHAGSVGILWEALVDGQHGIGIGVGVLFDRIHGAEFFSIGIVESTRKSFH
mmetsp:Transcript_39485/g.68423  ORF Transcript_39485/g.68423 Transcript_39485/m.68423 type:complete len:228 (-) Transcript_39485:413-1096(-)